MLTRPGRQKVEVILEDLINHVNNSLWVKNLNKNSRTSLIVVTIDTVVCRMNLVPSNTKKNSVVWWKVGFFKETYTYLNVF